MKLFFSSLLLFSQLSWGAMINVYHEDQLLKAKIVQKIFIRKYYIPSKMIQLKEQECSKKMELDQRFFNLCITKKGELLQLPSYMKFIRKSLKSFSTP